MWLEAVHQPSCDAPRCPTCGGAIRRRAHRELHGGSFVSDGQRVEIRGTPPAGYADPVVLDPLVQYFDGRLWRIFPHQRYFSQGSKYLHRLAWSSVFGPVPKGCHIHHRDGNRANNAVANLECLPAGEHLSLEWKLGKSANTEHFSANARAAAAAWHASDEGRLWHRRHAQRSQSWLKWKREPRACLACGTTFDCLIRANGLGQKFCTTNCKAAHYRQRRAVERAGRRVVSDSS